MQDGIKWKYVNKRIILILDNIDNTFCQRHDLIKLDLQDCIINNISYDYKDNYITIWPVTFPDLRAYSLIKDLQQYWKELYALDGKIYLKAEKEFLEIAPKIVKSSNK
jgi:hypothetical protein